MIGELLEIKQSAVLSCSPQVLKLFLFPLWKRLCQQRVQKESNYTSSYYKTTWKSVETSHSSLPSRSLIHLKSLFHCQEGLPPFANSALQGGIFKLKVSLEDAQQSFFPMFHLLPSSWFGGSRHNPNTANSKYQESKRQPFFSSSSLGKTARFTLITGFSKQLGNL